MLLSVLARRASLSRSASSISTRAAMSRMAATM
jgi:hypothetical protein